MHAFDTHFKAGGSLEAAVEGLVVPSVEVRLRGLALLDASDLDGGVGALGLGSYLRLPNELHVLDYIRTGRAAQKPQAPLFSYPGSF